MNNKRQTILFFVLSCFFAACECMEMQKCPPLSLNDCLHIALDQNPSARAAAQGILTAQANVGMAQAPYYPDLTFNTSYTRIRLHFYLPRILNFIPQFLKTPLTVIGPQNDWNVYFQSTYSIYDGGKMRAQLKGSQALLAAANEEAEQTRQQIILNVSLAFYGLLADQQLLAVARENFLRMEEHVNITKERKEVGSAPLSDVLRIKVSAADAKRSLAKAESTVRMATGDLNMAMGLPVDTPLEVIPSHEPVADPKSIDLPSALDVALCQRPEVRASEQHLKLAFARIQEARSAFMPQLYAQGSYGWRNSHFLPHTKNWAVGVSMEVPIFQGGGDIHRLRESEALFAQEQAQHDSLVQKIRQDVWNAYYRLQDAFEEIIASQALIVDARESLRLIQERYVEGASTLRDLLDTHLALAQAEVSLAEAHWNYRGSYELFLWTQGFLDVQ